MKRAIVLVVFVAAGFAGGVLWMRHREAASAPPPNEHAPAAAPADKEAAGPQVSRDTNGNAVITVSSKTQKDMGILLKSPTTFQMSPELKGYGRVLDPAPLVALIAEVASAQAAYSASSTELARLKPLAAQGNASARALQTAEAAATRDGVAIQSAKERLILSWGEAVAGRTDLSAFVHELTTLEAALVRVDLPVGDTLKDPPAGARIANLSSAAAEAAFLERAPSVDPQMQGQGFLFLLKPNALGLKTGEAVISYLKVPGEPLSGVIIPREAVVRVEGVGWIYVLNEGGEGFTRIEIPLDHPTEEGWFVAKGAAATDHVVTTGAQQLLSFELRGAGGGE